MTLITSLSRRQVQVRKALLDGKTNREIALSLGLDESTVKVYSSTLYRKLGVKNRAGLAALEIADLRARLDRARKVVVFGK